MKGFSKSALRFSGLNFVRADIAYFPQGVAVAIEPSFAIEQKMMGIADFLGAQRI